MGRIASAGIHAGIALLIAATSGCEGETCPPLQPTPIDPEGEWHTYVVDTIDLPSSAEEARLFGRDLDRDDRGRPDNALASVLSIFASVPDVDLDAQAQQLIDAGEILHLVRVQSTSLAIANGVGVELLHGLDSDGDPSDNFSGDERFGIDGSRPQGLLSGLIYDDGFLIADVGTAPVAVTFPGLDEPLILPLVNARIDGYIDGDEIQGVIAGGIPEEEVETVIIPLFAEGMRRLVDRDCADGVCETDSTGEVLLELFDDDMDGTLTDEEVAGSFLTASLLAPDLDLLDHDGNLAPLCDGEKDHLSVGLAFTAVPATISP